MDTDQKLKTGTTTVGIVCKDGVVLAADKRVTAGFVAGKDGIKIHPLTDYIAVTWAGSVSDLQLLTRLTKAEIMLKDLQVHRKSAVQEVVQLVSSLLYGHFRSNPFMPPMVAFLLGGIDDKGVHLYDIDMDGAVLPYKDYHSTGSGSLFAFGVLEANYKKDMTLDEGVKLAVKAINAAAKRDIYTGNGILVYTISEKGVQQVIDKQLQASLED
jgi:proteasome beta subunit